MALCNPFRIVNAFGPTSPSLHWYDEMLIAGKPIAVIGYSYERGGYRSRPFISTIGRLAFGPHIILRSNDYYSSRNYASR